MRDQGQASIQIRTGWLLETIMQFHSPVKYGERKKRWPIKSHWSAVITRTSYVITCRDNLLILVHIQHESSNIDSDERIKLRFSIRNA